MQTHILTKKIKPWGSDTILYLFGADTFSLLIYLINSFFMHQACVNAGSSGR